MKLSKALATVPAKGIIGHGAYRTTTHSHAMDNGTVIVPKQQYGDAMTYHEINSHNCTLYPCKPRLHMILLNHPNAPKRSHVQVVVIQISPKEQTRVVLSSHTTVSNTILTVQELAPAPEADTDPPTLTMTIKSPKIMVPRNTPILVTALWDIICHTPWCHHTTRHHHSIPLQRHHNLHWRQWNPGLHYPCPYIFPRKYLHGQTTPSITKRQYH